MTGTLWFGLILIFSALVLSYCYAEFLLSFPCVGIPCMISINPIIDMPPQVNDCVDCSYINFSDLLLYSPLLFLSESLLYCSCI